MFLGEYKHIIDEKGRVFIPTKFHPQLKNGAVLTRGLDNCLFLFPIKNWEVLAAKIKSLPLTQSNSRAFSRLMLAGALEVKLDNQGRVLITDFLKKYANIEKNIVIVGMYDRLEIWEESAWETYKQQTEKNSNDIAENLTNLGI